MIKGGIMDAVYLVGVTRIQSGKGAYWAHSYFPRAVFGDLDEAYEYFLRVEKEVEYDNGYRIHEAYLIRMHLDEEPDLSSLRSDNFDLLEGRIFET